MKYEKQDNKLKVTRPERVIEGEVKEYNLNYLKNQEQAILAQIERRTARLQVDLDEVREMITEAEKLGVKEEIYENKLTRE